MNTINDLELCEHVLKIVLTARKLEELERDGKGNELFWALEKIGMAAKLAQYRLMEIK